jgi:hypothetical protein
MEGTIQSLGRWQEEARFSERLDRIEPNLREELSRGTDSKKRFANQAATLFLKEGEYPPGQGNPSVPFYSLVDMECGTDDSCRVAEWFRYRGTLEHQLAQNERFLEIVGPPSIFDAERSLRQYHRPALPRYPHSFSRAPTSKHRSPTANLGALYVLRYFLPVPRAALYKSITCHLSADEWPRSLRVMSISWAGATRVS